MARRKEGTVTAGFVCDAERCGLNAIWSPIICVPYLEHEDWPPILTFTDVHVCHHHWKSIKRDLATDHMREAIRTIANQKGGKPDFYRMFFSRISPQNGDYHVFQVNCGLIPPDDAMGAPVTIDLRGV